MKLPVPKQLDTTVILETYSKNELPFKFSEVQISINGPDIVVKTADGHTMTFPFAAQFATMGKQVFTLVFADGKEIPSDQLLAYVTTVTVAPSVAAPVAHHDEGKGTAEKESSKEVSKEETKVVTQEEVVVVETPPQETAGADHADAAHKQPPVVHPGDLSKHRFDSEELPRVDHISGLPPKPENPPVKSDPVPVDETPPIVDVEPTPVEPTPVEPTPVEPTPVEPPPVEPPPVDPTPVEPTPEDPPPVDPPPVDPTPEEPPKPLDPPVLKDVVLLKTQGVADQSTHDYILGGGVDAARTDGRVTTQYATRDVDLSHETDGWTIHADSSAGVVEPGSMMRIVSTGSVSALLGVSVSAELAAKGVSIVMWNSDEGIALGLKSNEFALHYPMSKQVLDGVFAVHIDFVDSDSGQTGAADINFQVIDSPTALRNENDVYQLSRHENDVFIHAGSGDDTIIAGQANGVYDGGAGVNTLDYSAFSTALVVDLSADVRSALGIAPTGAITVDMGRVKTGDTMHSIENIQIIKGGSGANTFIGNEFDHQFIGGNGDTTFIANGGNNVYTGGTGNNFIDYSRAGGTAFGTATLGASGRSLVLDGIDVDMSTGITANNGWVDANGKAGADQFSGVNKITGSSHNDRIKGSSGDDVIFGGAGDDLILGSTGNDTIDGGTGYNTMSYAGMSGAVDVDLNGVTGSAVKSDGGTDTLTHIQAVIGSAGGGTLTGLTGSTNLLIGTDGDTRFVTNAGTNQLYGGAGNNTFNVTEGTNAIFGGATFNAVHSEGGNNTLVAGDGVNVFQANGGSNTFRGGAGTDTFLGTNGGTNTMLGRSGTSEFHATGGGANTITAGSGAMHVFSGEANNTVKGGMGGAVTVDYSAYEGSGHLEISLDRNLALVGNDFVDRLFDIDVIIGNKGGNGTIKGGSKGIEIHVSGDNNVLIGGVGKNIFDGGSGKNNTVDYSGTTGALNINMETGDVSKNGYGFTDRIENIGRILGNGASGNVYQGKNGVDIWIDMGTGANGKVIGSKGNDTYISHSAINTIDYSLLSAAINLDTSTGIVQKGVNGKDTLTNAFSTVIGTNHGDVITAFAGVNVLAGAGDDKIIFKGAPFPTTMDGGGGRNELDASTASMGGGKLLAYMIGADGRSGTIQGVSSADWVAGTVSGGVTSAATFKNIDVLGTSNLSPNLVNWGTASRITINGSTNMDYFFVNGGGNHINGGYSGAGETIAAQSNSRAMISYKAMKIGVNADFDSGIVSFADGRDNDTITNFSRFTGTTSNDVIYGHTNQNDWIAASSGDDVIDARGGTANVYSIDNGSYRVNADFDSGTILKYNATNGSLMGTDTVAHFQQYYGGNQNNDVVHGKNGVDMTFYMGSGGTKTLIASYGNNTIDGGGSTTTLTYEGMVAPVVINLTAGTVDKGVGAGVDTYKSISKVLGTAGDDIFTFNTQADVVKSSIDGAGGHDVLQKSGTAASTYDLTTMLAKVSNIEKIDFSTSTAADKITIDFANLATRGNETLTLTTGAKDTITMTNNTQLNGWTHTTSVTDGHTTDIYALGGHQLIWNH
jgi:Ca2+-binding RTX toxin-like protein